MWSKPDKQGELVKRGHVVKSWKTRWFIIQNDLMFYFKNRGVQLYVFFYFYQDQKPKGVIPLRNSICKETTKASKAYCFEVNAQNISKIFIIQANSQQEVKEWMQAIEVGSEYSSVSAPYNVQHEIHVDFDSATGFSVNIIFG